VGDSHAGVTALRAAHENIGKHLRLHPRRSWFGVFDEELKPWEGVMQALYRISSATWTTLRLKFETAAQHPPSVCSRSPRGAARASTSS